MKYDTNWGFKLRKFSKIHLVTSSKFGIFGKENVYYAEIAQQFCTKLFELMKGDYIEGREISLDPFVVFKSIISGSMTNKPGP